MYQSSAADIAVINAVNVVVGSLKDGLCFINKVYEGLIDTKIDPITGQILNYTYIREQIVNAKQSLQRSEQEANKGLKLLDGNIEILTRDEGNLNQDVRNANLTLANLRTEQMSNESLLKQHKSGLELAKKNLLSAKQTLQSVEGRRYSGSVITGVGAGLMAIPGIGCLVGIPMVIAGTKEMEQANYAVRTAEAEVRRSESEVTKYTNMVSASNSKVSVTEMNIRQKYNQIMQINEKIQKLKEQRTAVAELQEKVRKAVHILSALSGKADVVESQTRRHIVLEPVMKVMEEVMKAAGQIKGSQLLYDGDIPRLLSVMRENNSKLAAICAKHM